MKGFIPLQIISTRKPGPELARGFTLVELIVVTLILAMFLSSLLFIFAVTNRSWFGGNTAIDIRHEIIKAVMTMDKELRQTSMTTFNPALVLGVPVASVTFSPPDLDTDGNILLNGLGSIVWNTTAPITYSRNASGLLLRNGVTLANDISALSFTRTQDNQIQVDIAAQKADNSGRIFQDSESHIIKLRN